MQRQTIAELIVPLRLCSAISARSLRGQLLVLGLRITVFDTVDANENLYDCPKADPHSYEYRRSSWKSH